jgi:hypothetical protein
VAAMAKRSGKAWYRTTALRAAIKGEAFCSQASRTATSEAAGIILTAPAEEAQVDYGSGPMVRDPKTGKCRHDCFGRSDPRLQPRVRAPAVGG